MLKSRKRLLVLGFFPLMAASILIVGYSFLNLDVQPDICFEAPAAPFDLEEISISTLLVNGENAPEISLPDVYGNNFSLSALRGKVVLLNFMGTWCASCVWEMGDLIDIHNIYGGEDVVFLSVAIESDGTVDDVIDFKSKYCADWTFILDDDRDIFSSFKVEFLPTTFIIDRFGAITYSRVGLIDPQNLSNVLEESIKS